MKYLIEKYEGRRASFFKMWHEVKEAIKTLGLPSAYHQLAVKDAVEAYNAWAEAGRRGARLPTQTRGLRAKGPTALSIRLMSERHVVDLWLHKRYWKFEWLVKTGRAGRASTIRLRRVKNRLYAIFAYEVEPGGPSRLRPLT